MKTKSIFIICCLVTLTMPLQGFAQEEEDEMIQGEEVTSCEKEAMDLELTSQEEIDAFIIDCEKAEAGMQMEDDSLQSE